MGSFVALFKKLLGKLGSFLGFTASQAASYAIGSATSATIEPMIRPLVYAANARTENMKLDPSSLRDALFRGVIPRAEYESEMSALGFSKENADNFMNIGIALLNVGDVQNLYNRGTLSKDESEKRFTNMGFAPERAKELLELAGYIPTVPDFIRMAVREVFTPEIAEKFGQFQDQPKDLEKYAKMAGLRPDFAKFYWAAHWELPSYSEGVAMYHRGIINKEMLETLLRSLDVMPY